MPSIEITQEQADALARGENVTLAPTKQRYWIVRAGLNLFMVESPRRPKINEFVAYEGRRARVLHWEGIKYERGEVTKDCCVRIREVFGESLYTFDGKRVD